MTITDYIKLGVGAFCFLYSLITTIIAVVKAKKNKKTAELKKLLTEELIPLMEQAETFIGYSGEEKEEWVIKKLADKLHIDLFKYKNILKLIQEIIANICEQTKIQVNNLIVKEQKKGQDKDETIIY